MTSPIEKGAASSKIGLTSSEASARLDRDGPNAVESSRRRSIFSALIQQFASPLVYLLLFALVLDTLFWLKESGRGWPLEPIAIAAILVTNSLLGMIQARRAEAALEKLRDLSTPYCWAYRDDVLIHLPARDLVTEDMLRIEEGARVPADCVVVQGHGSADESLLTGEPFHIEKSEDSELFAGTMFVRGSLIARVLRTGPRSSLGKIAVLLASIKEEPTPLENKLTEFGKTVARWVLGMAAVLIAIGLILEGSSSAMQMTLLAVALAVAAVPEGLPAVLTVCLSAGVERMAKRKAVVRRLAAVEALGSVTVIATDKTGTLTENRIRVASVEAPDEAMALRVMIIANDGEPNSDAGDPLDRALLDHALAQGEDVDAIRGELTRHASRPFDSKQKSMRVTVHEKGRLVSYVKGAPEVILDGSSLTPGERKAWDERLIEAAQEGRRVLALGWREESDDKTLTFAGLVTLADPPRPEARGAIAAAISAGIRVIMVTGDHPETAVAIARSVGIPTAGSFTHSDFPPTGLLPMKADVNVYARVTPEDKLRLVETLQAAGEIVAMTGDGVNDAPALKKANLAVAMGKRGSDVAREVSDLVLLDDNFATIVAAIEEGRGIYENIRKFVRFLFSTDVALVLLVFIATLGAHVQNLRNPSGTLLLALTPLMLLWINIISDGVPALALGLDGNAEMMNRPPRDPREPLLDGPTIRFILSSGIFKAGTGLAILWLVPIFVSTRLVASTVLFHFEALAQLAFAYPSRGVSVGKRPNTFLAGSILVTIALQALLAFWPPARQLFQLQPLNTNLVLIILGSGAIAWGSAELLMRRILGKPLP